MDKGGVLWRLDPLLQRRHDLAAIASQQGWGIEPEPRKVRGAIIWHSTREVWVLRMTLQEALELYRQTAREAVGEGYEEEVIAL